MPIGCGILRQGRKGGGMGANCPGRATRGMSRALAAGRGWASGVGSDEATIRRRDSGAGLLGAAGGGAQRSSARWQIARVMPEKITWWKGSMASQYIRPQTPAGCQ